MSELVDKVGAIFVRRGESAAIYDNDARAAIATVFDWLAEPGEEYVERAWWLAPEYVTADVDTTGMRHIWTTMLAEMRRAALGE